MFKAQNMQRTLYGHIYRNVLLVPHLDLTVIMIDICDPKCLYHRRGRDNVCISYTMPYLIQISIVSSVLRQRTKLNPLPFPVQKPSAIEVQFYFNVH